MKKQEFLDLLRFYLRSLPANIVDDIVADYDLHYQAGLDQGRSEEDISQELGTPQDLAQDYLEHEDPGLLKNYQPQARPGRGWSWLLWILALLGLVVAGPLVFGLSLGVLGLVLGLAALVLSLVLTSFLLGLASFLSVFVNLDHVSWLSLGDLAVLHPVSRFFLGLTLLFFGLILVLALVQGLAGLKRRLGQAYRAWRWKRKKKKLEEEPSSTERSPS